MSDEHQRGVGRDALLLRGADADVVASEHSGDGVQHTGLIGHLQAEQVLGTLLVDRPNCRTAERPERTVAELSGATGLHANTVREHLQRPRLEVLPVGPGQQRGDQGRVGGVPVGELAVVGVLGTGYAAATVILSDPRVRFDPALPTLRDLFILLLVGVAAPSVISLAYVAVYVAFGLLPTSEYPAAFVHHWVGDAIGIFVVTPFLLSLLTAPRLPTATVESAFQISAIAAALWVIFSYARASEFQFFYLLFLPIIWR